MRADKYGRGPAATSCAFWNDFLPRLRNWGELRSMFVPRRRTDFYIRHLAINFVFNRFNPTMRDNGAREKILSRKSIYWFMLMN